MNTKEKEQLGEQAIKKYNIFDVYFPNNLGYKKITTKKKQLSGVDYEIYFEHSDEPVYIDLKTGIGPDYSMKKEDSTIDFGNIPAIAIELRQNGIFTNIHKLTDYFLYYVKDNTREFFTLVPFKTVQKLCIENDDIYRKNKGITTPKVFTTYTSFNNTGTYIKVPANIGTVTDF